MAISGSTVLVGSPYSTVAGVAYVFVRSGSTWSEQAELSASQGGAWDAFGDEVALSGSTAVIGAPYGGEAYVFAQSGTTWTQEAELTASDGDALDGAVAIFTYPREPSRWTVVAGSPDGNSQMGAAYVFAGSGASWTQQAELTASDGAKYYQFGNSVAVSGATVVVGEVATSGKPGAAYVFVRSGTSWSQQAELTNSAAGGDFGWAVAIYHNTAVISAPGPAPSGADVFERSGSAWSEKEELIGSDPSDTGTGRVAVDGSEAIVGAPGASVGGAAYVFQHI